MMASAMLRAGAVLGDEEARAHAILHLARIRDERLTEDAVTHTPGGVAGLLDDQVQVAAAALDAYEATGDGGWLTWAARLMDRVWADYWDPEAGGLFDTARARGSEPGLLPARAKPVQDAPTPSPNGVAGMVAARLHEHTGEARWRERGHALVRAFAGRAAELGILCGGVSARGGLAPLARDSPGRSSASRAMPSRTGCTPTRWRPSCRAASCGDSRPATRTASALPPAMAGMVAAGRAPRGYACTGTSCRAPAERWSMAGHAGGAEPWRTTTAPRPSEELSLTLDPSSAQRQAIEAPLGPVLVVAGPGAGKTYCLIARIARLIAWHGLRPPAHLRRHLHQQGRRRDRRPAPAGDRPARRGRHPRHAARALLRPAAGSRGGRGPETRFRDRRRGLPAAGAAPAPGPARAPRRSCCSCSAGIACSTSR